MAIAGKVAPVTKGDWNSETSYEKLNVVRHNECVFMARQANSNKEPVAKVTDAYWMYLISGGGSTGSLATEQQVQDLIDELMADHPEPTPGSRIATDEEVQDAIDNLHDL